MGAREETDAKVVIAARISAELEARIKALGPTSRVVRAALQRCVTALEREWIEAYVRKGVDRALRQGRGFAFIPQLRQALPEIHPRTLDMVLLALQRRGEYDLREGRKDAPPPPGGLEVRGRGLMLWIAGRGKAKPVS
jgi:hypothetical protein